MSYVTVSVDIDASDVLEEIDTANLCEELVTRHGWAATLDKVVSGKVISSEDDETLTSIREVCERMRAGKPYEQQLRDISYNQFGFVI